MTATCLWLPWGGLAGRARAGTVRAGAGRFFAAGGPAFLRTASCKSRRSPPRGLNNSTNPLIIEKQLLGAGEKELPPDVLPAVSISLAKPSKYMTNISVTLVTIAGSSCHAVGKALYKRRTNPLSVNNR